MVLYVYFDPKYSNNLEPVAFLDTPYDKEYRFLEEAFFSWRRSLFLEEVDFLLEEVFFIGGGVFFWRKCFLLEEVMCVFGAGWH